MEKLLTVKAGKMTAAQVVALVAGQPDFAAVVLKGLRDAGIKSPKAEKEYVATRIQTKDTSPTANTVRLAGQEFPLTELALTQTLKTWCKGADAEKTIAAHVATLKSGGTVEFSSFKLVGINE
jgi:hypothetical protein